MIQNCLHSIYAGTRRTEFEVIVLDNGSTDGSVGFIRQNYPKARVLKNGANLGFASDRHPKAGGFGCRVLNPDGSYQESPRPFPSVWGDWIAALYLRPLAYLSDIFVSDTYTGWQGDTEHRLTGSPVVVSCFVES